MNYYLIYDPLDVDDTPFEFVKATSLRSARCVSYCWFNVSSLDLMFSNGGTEPMSVLAWVRKASSDSTGYILHTFESEPTQADVLSVINSHPELLI